MTAEQKDRQECLSYVGDTLAEVSPRMNADERMFADQPENKFQGYQLVMVVSFGFV